MGRHQVHIVPDHKFTFLFTEPGLEKLEQVPVCRRSMPVIILSLVLLRACMAAPHPSKGWLQSVWLERVRPPSLMFTCGLQEGILKISLNALGLFNASTELNVKG